MSKGALTRALVRSIAILLMGLAAACGGGGGGNNSTSTPAPTPVALTSLTPAALNAGAPATVVTATGSGFTTSSVIEWNGTALPTSYVSATSLTATLPATDLADPESVAVTVSNAASGGASSAIVNFTISEQTAPTIASLAPSMVTAGNVTFQLLVTGTNFLSSASILWNGVAIPTTFDSATQLTGQVTAAQVATAGSVPVTVSNDTAAGGTSNVSTFNVSAEPVPPPAPMLTSLSPTSIQTNSSGVTLTLNGTNFTATTTVSYNSQILQPTYVSPTQLTVPNIPVSYQAGSVVNVAVTDPASGYIFSNSLQITITAAIPVATGIAPATITVDQGALALTVSGQYFTSTSVVYFNGGARPTTLNQQGQLVAQLSATDVSSAGTETITVQDPASGGVASNAVSLVIQPLPALTLTSLSPAAVPAGNSNFTLTVFGNGFATNSTVTWNGTSLATTYVSGTTLQTSVSSTLVASIGTASIAVINSATQGGGASSPLILTVAARSKDAVSYQIDNGHTGSITFNSVTLPASASWSVNLAGQPSYALIVGGLVYVLVDVNGNSQLSAFDSTTGALVWGPIAFSSVASMTYDAGTVFVNSGGFTGIISALNATTGNPKWSAAVPGGWFNSAPPVASQGLVYAVVNGTVAAFNQSNGAQVWLANAMSGTNGTVAVTVDGVYVSGPCTPVDFQPATGAVVWKANTGCEGGGGDTPVVGGGRMYAPINSFFSGNVYDAESGNLLSGFNYTAPPAISASTAYTLFDSTLQGVSLSNNQILWSFAGDGALVTAPLVVNNYVFIGSSNGNLYALDGTSGAQLWTKNLGAALPSASTAAGFSSQMISGLAAGDGLLIVPAGNTISAFVLSTNP